MSPWPKTKLEVRTGLVFAGFWGGLALVFVLPMLFSDSVTMSSDIGLLGELTTKTAPGVTFVVPLLLFVFSFAAIGFMIGVGLRKKRQLILLGASSPEAPVHLRNAKSRVFWDRWIYRLTPNGLHADQDGNGPA